MFRLTPEAEPALRRRIQGSVSFPWLLMAQLVVLAGFLLLMLREPFVGNETAAQSGTRVRYTVTRPEWPAGPPSLKQIQDRYVGDLPAMRIANQPGSCADPSVPIDYGDVVFIEFAPDSERCIEEQATGAVPAETDGDRNSR